MSMNTINLRLIFALSLAADQRSLWLLELGPEAAPAPVENRSTNGVAPRF